MSTLPPPCSLCGAWLTLPYGPYHQGAYVFGICLFVCQLARLHKNYSIFTKFGEKVAHGPGKKPLDFGGNPDNVTLGIESYGMVKVVLNRDQERPCKIFRTGGRVTRHLFSIVTFIYDISGPVCALLTAILVIIITGSEVALHCGKPQVQSQWERPNFDLHDIKIP